MIAEKDAAVGRQISSLCQTQLKMDCLLLRFVLVWINLHKAKVPIQTNYALKPLRVIEPHGLIAQIPSGQHTPPCFLPGEIGRFL